MVESASSKAWLPASIYLQEPGPEIFLLGLYILWDNLFFFLLVTPCVGENCGSKWPSSVRMWKSDWIPPLDCVWSLGSSDTEREGIALKIIDQTSNLSGVWVLKLILKLNLEHKCVYPCGGQVWLATRHALHSVCRLFIRRCSWGNLRPSGWWFRKSHGLYITFQRKRWRISFPNVQHTIEYKTKWDWKLQTHFCIWSFGQCSFNSSLQLPSQLK